MEHACQQPSKPDLRKANVIEECRGSRSPFRVSRYRCRVGRPALMHDSARLGGLERACLVLRRHVGRHWMWRCASCTQHSGLFLSHRCRCVRSQRQPNTTPRLRCAALLLRSSGVSLDTTTEGREWLVIRIYHGTCIILDMQHRRADPWEMEVRWCGPKQAANC